MTRRNGSEAYHWSMVFIAFMNFRGKIVRIMNFALSKIVIFMDNSLPNRSILEQKWIKKNKYYGVKIINLVLGHSGKCIQIVTSSGGLFQYLTSSLSGNRQNVQNWISGGVSSDIFPIESRLVPINAYLVVIGSVGPVGSVTVITPNVNTIWSFN